MQNLKKPFLAFPWLISYFRKELEYYTVKDHDTLKHLMVSVANHFEPHWPGGEVPLSEAVKRVRNWCKEYPRFASKCRDLYGWPFRHTYFFPAEEYSKETFQPLVDLCSKGFGEIEVHLHHGVKFPDNAQNLRNSLINFKDILIQHKCIPKRIYDQKYMYAFVHGNWALGNVRGGLYCGVDDELAILQETGCYADFTLPSFPDPSQISKINSIYECRGDLRKRAPQRWGIDCEVNRPISKYPLIVQGQLMIDWRGKKFENSSLKAINMPTIDRFNLWRKANITVKGRPEWIFIKLHCHGLIPNDHVALLSDNMVQFLQNIVEKGASNCVVHFVTCREMFNIIAAACDGKKGDPEEYRNYLLLSPFSTHAQNLKSLS